MGLYCNAQIIMKLNIEKNKPNEFCLINLHSEACQELHRQIILENNKQIETWENYKTVLYNFLDTNRRRYWENFKY